MPTADGYTQCGQCGTVGRAHPQGKVLCAWGEAFTSSRRINLATNPLILAVEAVLEESTQQKIGLVK